MCTAVRLLLCICPLFLYFSFSSVHKLKIFITLFLGTVRPRKFKLGTLVDSGWLYHVHQNQAAATYLSLYFFIFLSLQLSNINIFITLLSGTVRLRNSLNLVHMRTVSACIVYTGIRLLLLLICPFIGPFFFLSNFQLQICLSPLIAL